MTQVFIVNNPRNGEDLSAIFDSMKKAEDFVLMYYPIPKVGVNEETRRKEAQRYVKVREVR